jgi:hypothetical protein
MHIYIIYGEQEKKNASKTFVRRYLITLTDSSQHTKKKQRKALSYLACQF